MKQGTTQFAQACIGFDLGDDLANYCLIGAEGEVEMRGTVPMERNSLTDLLQALPKGRVVLEASTQSHWVSAVMRSIRDEVYVANPRRLPLLTQSSRKTDRNDAELLARIGRLDVSLLSPVHQRTEACMHARAHLRTRSLLVRMRVRLANSVRSTLKVFGHKPVTCAVECVASRHRPIVPEELISILEPLFASLEAFNQQIKQLDRALEAEARHFPESIPLRQIHGVGPLVSLAFVTAIGNPRRFKDSRCIGAYLGLTPKSRQSGAADPRLPISKEGDGTVRSLLVTAATHILRKSAPDTDLKRYGKRIAAGGTPRDKGRARVAVARKLAVLLHRLWLTGEVYEPLRAANTTKRTD